MKKEILGICIKCSSMKRVVTRSISLFGFDNGIPMRVTVKTYICENCLATLGRNYSEKLPKLLIENTDLGKQLAEMGYKGASK